MGKTILAMLMNLAVITGLMATPLALAIDVRPIAGPIQPGSAAQTSTLQSPAASTEPTAPSAFGTSLAIDLGSGGYVSVTHSAAIQPTVAATYEAWIQRSTTAPFGCHAILGKDSSQAYWLGLCFDRIRFHSGGEFSGQDGTTVIPAGVWTHIAVVWDTTNNTRKYYINGDLEYTGAAGTAPVGTRELRIGYDGVNPTDGFAGNLAEVRIWNVARSQDDIRHTMHVALQEPLPGLIADWHLSDNYVDSIGGHNGVPIGPLSFTGPAAPAQPVYVTIDKDFNTLPYGRYGAATVYLTRTNQALLIGGILNGSVTNRIDVVDAATGMAKTFGNLPSSRAFTSAAYVPDRDTVYVFGGSDTTNATTYANTIYAIDFPTGTVRTLAATLPVPAYSIGAVYHPQQKRIYLLGGYSGSILNSINVFNPQAETIGASSFTLPQPNYQMAAIYSPLSDRIYTFGGWGSLSVATDTIYALNFTSPTGGAVTLLPKHLPQADYTQNPVQDAHTGLIYLIGGNSTDQVLAFDPLTNDLWTTLIKLPQTRPYGGAIYTDRNRTALFIGGGYYLSNGDNFVYRIPLGDGPNLPVGRWDFPQAVGQRVNAITGQKNVYVATNGEGFWRYYSNGTRFQFPGFFYGSANGIVYRMTYDQNNNLLWFGTSDAGGWSYDGSALVGYTPTSTIGSLQYPVYSAEAGFFGHHNGLAWFSFPGWRNNFAGRLVTAVAHRPQDAPEPPLIVEQEWILGGTLPPPNKPDQPTASTELERLSYTFFTGGASETNYGGPCGVDATDLAFDRHGSWWIPNGLGVCFIPYASTPGAGNQIYPLIGGLGQQVSVDKDGRIWVAYRGNGGTPNNSGGLAAYEAVGTSPAITVTTSEFNWLNAPVGSRIYGIGNWLSNLTAVGAADERVWAGRSDGQLLTMAQRWQQIDQSDDIGQQAIEHIWMARGRAFMSTATAGGGGNLYVLMPDGKTWDNRSGLHIRSVLGDSQGRTWIGTDNDVRLYTPTGWITFTASPAQGTPPTGLIDTIAEDQQGRIWIGGANGLTLFDRNRFVFTLNTSNFGLPSNNINTLAVDRDNALWIGTPGGLAKLSGSTLITYTTASGLPSNSIYSLAQTGDGTVAISTDNGFAIISGTTVITEVLPIPATNLPLTLDNLGHVWAGSAVRTGANTWFAYYNNNSGLRSSTISNVAADGADKVWFSHAPDTGVSVRAAFLPPLADSVPIISSITPDSGSAGDLITINGTGFGSNVGAVQVTIGGAAVDVISVAPTAILVRLNRDNLSGDVDVRVGKRHTTLAGSIRSAFCAIPYLYSFTPTGGDYGVPIDVNGGNFDPGMKLNVGSGPTRSASWDTPRHFKFPITAGDVTGNLKLTNTCPGVFTTDSREFRVITLNIDKVFLNQGLPAYELVSQRPTLVQHFVTRSADPRSTDRITADSIELQFTNPQTNLTSYKTVPFTRTLLTTLGAPSAAVLKDIANSVNVPNFFPNTPLEGGTLNIKSILMNRGYIVAQTTTSWPFQSNAPVRVLLIPIMHQGYTANDLTAMQNNVMKNIYPLTARLMPQGRVDLHWAYPLERNDKVDIGNAIKLYEVSHDLDRVRKEWNKSSESYNQVVVAFGIVDGTIVTGTAAGKAFWPDLSAILNKTALVPLKTLCEITNTTAKIFTFGLAGDFCNIDIPLYVGWARGNAANSSALIAHELGHISGLVKDGALNGNLTDNWSHSVNDEISNGECKGSGEVFSWAKSLYMQPNVSEPVVDPISGEQYPPQNDGSVNTARGKGIMSYACAKNDSNVFFEPADYANVRGPNSIFLQQGGSKTVLDLLRVAQAAGTLRPSGTITVTGPRLAVSGIITRSTEAGRFINVDRLDGEPPLSPAFVTGYDLVQRSAAGAELSRTGVFPIFMGTDDDHMERPQASSVSDNDAGYFSATILRATGLATLQLEHNGVVLASYHAGSAVPTITLSSPTSGTYNANVPVTWSASDANGDPLAISIEYTRDGVHWLNVANGAGNSGTITVPVFALGGSPSARVRAFVSDGFNENVFTSTALIVSNHPPLPSITLPQNGASFLEGQAVDLTGSTLDPQDGVITDTHLIWTSNRDGNLGAGQEVNQILSVGVHTITLKVTDSVGLTATTSISVNVQSDYALDGIPDAQKLTSGWNPLDDQLAGSDADHDGLPLIMELGRGTNPNTADSDGDGFTDAAEIAAGTDPNSSGDNPGTQPPDRLVAAPAVITFTADLIDAMPFPQQTVVVASRNPVSWTMSTNANWLTASATNGQTIAGTTIEALPYNLNNGNYTSVITFTSPQLSNAVTVTVKLSVINAGHNCDVNRDGVSDQSDVQLVTNAIGTNITQPNFNLRYDVNRDGFVTTADVQLAQACVARANAFKVYLPIIRR